MPVFKASGFFVPMRTTHIPVSPDWYTVILQTYANREHGEVTKRSMTMGAIARRITRVITAVVCVAVSVGVSVATLHVPTREGGGERFNPARYRSDVIVTMFQANWKSVARECGEVLGPEGVGYVQVSPPQESIQGTQWWTSYQPVSYKLDSKEGTEAEFKNMVRQCKAAGVGVIADTVINHTTGVDKHKGPAPPEAPTTIKAISLKPDTRHRTSMPPVLSGRIATPKACGTARYRVCRTLIHQARTCATCCLTIL